MIPQQYQPTRRRSKFLLWRILILVVFLVFGLKSTLGSFYAERGYQEGHQHQLNAAIRDCRTAIWWNSKSVMAHNNLGFYLFEEGKYAEALPECREAVRLDPLYQLGHDSLAQVLSHSGHLDEAVQECQEAIRLRPEHAVFYNSLGYALYQKGERAEARQQWTRAAAMNDPDAAADARQMLAQYPE